MLKRIHKFWWIWDFDKEEAWYNEMAAQGLNLTHIMPFNYFFEPGVPNEYIYRQELLDRLPSHPESQDYIHFMEETGVEVVCTYYRWIIFRKKAVEGAFDLFSDLDSKIRHLKRIHALMIPIGALNASAGLYNVVLSCTIDSPGNFWIGMFSLIIGGFLTAGIIRVWKITKKLSRERNIRE